MKTITLLKINNFGKQVRVRTNELKHLRCECNAEVLKYNKYCWWCGGIYKWENSNEKR